MGKITQHGDFENQNHYKTMILKIKIIIPYIYIYEYPSKIKIKLFLKLLLKSLLNYEFLLYVIISFQ